MKKLLTVLLGALSAAALAGQVYADAIPLPREEMSKVRMDPLVIVLIVIVIVVAALVVVGAVRSAKKRKGDDRSRRN